MGNHQHNCSVIESGKGEFLSSYSVIYRPKEEEIMCLVNIVLATLTKKHFEAFLPICSKAAKNQKSNQWQSVSNF